MTAGGQPARVRDAHVAWVRARLSDRDWQLVETVNRLGLISGWQLDRLHFTNLTGRSRTVTRSSTLARLVRWRVLYRLPRRIGGAARGSTVSVYAADTAGARLLAERANLGQLDAVVRRPGVPTERFVAHTLAISELFVELTEAVRTSNGLLLREFEAEPAAWWPDGRGGWLKPDAYLVVSDGTDDHLRWIEADNATESLPTIERKLRVYLDFVRRGNVGPRGTIPRVLISVPNEHRRQAVQARIARLPEPANELFVVTVAQEAVAFVLGELQGAG
ncbi:replication-relaxation family protein [Fodinicola acaciae]|uniref:replication-relaxation family protein n=1 Tax=Fodinicola acaciae TaxID=2681555 RepID=UPI0013D61F26|nr:replication-relaxation family protein [Fodinicola acaciae]